MSNVKQILGFWFLRCMAVCYLLSAIIYRSWNSMKIRWLVFGLVYCVMMFIPKDLFQGYFFQVVHMFPYFVFGLMVLGGRVCRINGYVAVCCGIFAFTIALTEGNAAKIGMSFWTGSAYWRDIFFDYQAFFTFIGRTIVGIASSVFVLWAADICMKKMPFLEKLAHFGTTTLGVYVIHEIILLHAGIGLVRRGWVFPSWSRWIIAVALLCTLHYIVIFIRKYAVSRVLLFGDEAFLSTKLNAITNVVVAHDFFAKIGSRKGSQKV